MLPPYRLGAIFEQAHHYQETQCLYHFQGTFSLLNDHQCDRDVFPTVTTHILAEHSDEVWAIEFSHDGRFLASSGRDQKVFIWSIEQLPARTVRLHRVLQGLSEPGQVIAWSPDGSRLVVCAESTVYLFDTDRGEIINAMSNVHTDTITAVRWYLDGSGFITTGLDSRVQVWTNDGSRRNGLLAFPSMRIFDFVLTPDGKRLIGIAIARGNSATNDSKPSVSARMDKMSTGPSARDSIALSVMDRVILIYDIESAKLVVQRTVPHQLQSIQLAKDGNHILLSSVPDEIQLWSISDDALRLVHKYSGHMNRQVILRACFGGAPNRNNLIVSPSEDRHIYIWHRDTAVLMEILEGHHKGVNSVAWHPNHPALFASCSDDSTIRIWQPPSVAERNARRSAHDSSSIDVDPTLEDDYAEDHSHEDVRDQQFMNGSSPGLWANGNSAPAPADESSTRAPQTTTTELPTMSSLSPFQMAMDLNIML